MYDDYYYEDAYQATPAEAIREWAWNAGHEPHNIDCQWLSHPSFADCWTENPHYRGEDQPHPMEG